MECSSTIISNLHPPLHPQCVVQASDQRTKATNVTVTINVLRSQPPQFSNTPYSFQILETSQPGPSLYNVQAFDNDLEVSSLFYFVVDLVEMIW